jgi:hypothetical protein
VDARRGVSFAQRRSEGGGTTHFNEYYGTLRPETTFAHTSPVYVIKDDRPIRSREDAAYFMQYMANAMQWLEQEGAFPTDEAKQEVLQTFERGRESFAELAR